MTTADPNSRADAARDAFSQYLKNHNIRLTAPRQRILETVLGIKEHFEAEQVLYALQRRGERVAKATVYRTLPLLVDCGILKQVRFDVKMSHYELAYGDHPHDHLVCGQCGRIVEFSSDRIIELRKQIARKHKFRPVAHRFQVTGVCAECAQRESKAKRN